MSPADPQDRLNAGQLRDVLGNQPIGNRIVVLEETRSTNDVVAQMAPENPEGLVVFAETQTAARGQYGRRWESAAHKGLWLSILLRPNIAIGESAKLTDLLARAVARTINKQTGLNSQIKPPNDIYLANQKVAGVLVEMRVEANGNYAAVAGIGINVNQAPGDFPAELQAAAGSLAMATGQLVDRNQLAARLLEELNVHYAEFGVATLLSPE